MIDTVLEFLRKELGSHLDRVPAADRGLQDRVVFIDGAKENGSPFPANSLSLVLVAVAEDRGQGSSKDVIVLTVAVVSRFDHYAASLGYLSKVIQFFRTNLLFTGDTHPHLDPGISMAVEPLALPLHEEQQLWAALKATGLPSALYCVRSSMPAAPAPQPLRGRVSEMSGLT